ncbi:A.superbus venom factor 1-like [Ahaetulla prasina]|uniref:A.superbus venom factor 1-like n=1 Tax=Ahaetulla prasina TaxID=499056 RepID=UPI0026488799|nr:A.superbus venom factor 1-like [Ahaetulla prasina]
MKNSKAPGPDNLPTDFWKLKEVRGTGIPWLTEFFNAVINIEHLPTDWSTSVTVPIFKNKGDPVNCANAPSISHYVPENIRGLSAWQQEEKIKEDLQITEAIRLYKDAILRRLAHESYTLITPGVLRTDTEEQILVEAHGDNNPKQLNILVHDFPRKQKALFHGRVDMDPAGGMLVTPTIKSYKCEAQKVILMCQVHDSPGSEMVEPGRNSSADPEVSLTAFVLVVLLESKSICNEYIHSLESSIKNATDYLLKKYEKLQRPYTIALTAYALTAAERLDDDRVLRAASTEKNRWEEYNAHTHNIEGTSYALLALLKMKKFDQTGPIVRWLTDQKFYGGTYGQTQATIMVFQGLAEYEIQMPTHKDLNLDIVIRLPERKIPINYRVDATNAARAQTAETSNRYLGEVDSTMTIIDVSMLTGFLPDAEDLTRLSKGVDRYISKYEVDNNMAHIILDKIATIALNDVIAICILHNYMHVCLELVRLIWALCFSDEKCTKFYHPDKGTGLLNKICHGSICQCAEETCSLLNQQEKIDLQLRIEKACKENVDYVYKTKLLRIEEKDGNDIYVMEVLEVIKRGTGRNPQAKAHQYLSQRKCQEALNLKLDNDYLICFSSDLWPMKDNISYLITKNTWIERWPSEDECQDQEFQNLCDDFAQLSNTLTIFGCPN